MPLLKDDERATNAHWFATDRLAEGCDYRHVTEENNAWNLRHSALLKDWGGKWIGEKSSTWVAGAGVEFCAGREAQISSECGTNALRHRAEEYRVEFEELSKRWHRETKYLSVVARKLTHPAFLRIVGIGEPAIPLILESLRDRPSHWFSALRATANIDPVPPNANPSEARHAWLEWGRSQGYID
jgi:hypothetical protein